MARAPFRSSARPWARIFPASPPPTPRAPPSSSASRASVGATPSSPSRWTASPPASSRSASSQAIASASGRSIAPNGSRRNSQPPAPASSSSTSIPPTAPPSSNTRSTSRAARALLTAGRFKTSDYIGMLNELAARARRQPSRRARRRPPARAAHRRSRSTASPRPAASPSPTCSASRRRRPAPPRRRSPPPCSSTTPINIQFTSGTTGAPKGATLTHHNILNNGFFIGEAMRAHRARPPLHPGAALSLLRHGARRARRHYARRRHGLPRPRLRPARHPPAVAEERCTALHGVPTMFIAELDHPDFATFDLSSLRTGIMAGSPCPIAVMRRVTETMHLSEITIAYGMTETSPVSFQTATDDPLEQARLHRRPHPPPCRGQDHRRGGKNRPPRHARRALHPRLFA